MQSFSQLSSKLLRRYGTRIGIALLWIVGIGYAYFFLNHIGMTPIEVTLLLFTFLSTSWYGLILYVLMNAVRPLTLFPGSVLGVLAGIFFGFMLGLTLTVIGAALAAAVAYGVGRFFSYPRHTSGEEVAELSAWKRLLRTRTFESSVLLHISFLPFDAVNYFSGIMRVRFFQFLLGTTLGSLPGLTSFVSFGASLDLNVLLREGVTVNAIDVRFLFLSALIFGMTLLFSRFININTVVASKTAERD